jgi:predicted Zn-dependent protease with MMP-like domain
MAHQRKRATVRMSREEFDNVVKRAIVRLPEEVRAHLDNIVISVMRRPTSEIMEELDLHRSGDLLGLFRGVPLVERSVTSPPLYPDSILLFQEPLERACRTVHDLEEQIEITLVHEIAHYVGMTEERLAELGYG